MKSKFASKPSSQAGLRRSPPDHSITPIQSTKLIYLLQKIYLKNSITTILLNLFNFIFIDDFVFLAIFNLPKPRAYCRHDNFATLTCAIAQAYPSRVSSATSSARAA